MRATAASSPRPGRRPRATVLALLVLMTFGAGASAGDAASIALIERLHAIADAERIAAFAVIVTDRAGTLFDYRGGLVERVTRQPVGTEHRFRIGSITKSLGGVAAMRLVEAGSLDLDAPVTRYLARSGLSGPGAARVTTAQLLEHTAGLKDSIAAEFGPHDPAHIDLATALTLMPETLRLRWPPGRYSSYSNVGYGVAGRVLEVTGGDSYEAVMRREVFAPLGMSTATLKQTAEVADLLVHGYDTDGITPLPYWHMLYRSFGATTINPGDMAPLIRLFLNRGRHAGKQLLQPASIERIETPATSLAARSGLAYGYGLGNYASYYRGHLFHGHGGDADGYLAKFGYSHDLGRGYFLVLTAFNKRAQNAMHNALRDFVIDGAAAPAKPPRFAQPDLSQFTGRYRLATRRFGGWPPDDDGGQLVITVHDQKLYTRLGSGRPGELVPVTATHFRRRNQTGATYAFIRDGGALYLLGDIGNFLRDPAAAGNDSVAP